MLDVLAIMENYLDSPSWVGRSADQMDGQSPGIKYLYSWYFSVGAFAGLGDNDFFCASPIESLIMIYYLLFNIVLQAYILGTITMVMVKGHEKSRAFRDRIEPLRHFAKMNELAASLLTAMREHIELQFLRDQASDEQVLQDYPATLKRKALRHLYAHCLTSCPLLRGTRGRFLDQLLVVCRSEMFMPPGLHGGFVVVCASAERVQRGAVCAMMIMVVALLGRRSPGPVLH